jgi:protein TonB
MYAVQQPRSGSRLVGVSVAALATGLAAWALVSVGNQKILAPVQKVMTVMLLQADKPPPPKPIPVPKPEVKVDVPAPKLVVPDIPVVDEPPPIIAEPVPAEPIVEAPPAPAVPDTSPKLMAGAKPQYPPSSIRAQEQGRTTLSLCVNENGRVTSAKLAGSSGHPTLDNAALKWVDNARFKPATTAGKAVAMCDYNVIYQWDLKDARS